MTEYHLAQLNIATLKESLDSPALADFVANLDRINALAETSFRPLDENTIVNMSVWRDIESLNKYVYRSAHADIMRRRKEWFERMSEVFMVLWWIPAGHQPTIDEALKKLELLRQAGAGPEAFTFRNPFSKPVE